jgi:hypothetical protein
VSPFHRIRFVGGLTETPVQHLSRSIHPRDEPLQPAVIAGLTLAAAAVLLGFIILFILWRREYLRKRRERSGRLEAQSQSQVDPQGGMLVVRLPHSLTETRASQSPSWKNALVWVRSHQALHKSRVLTLIIEPFTTTSVPPQPSQSLRTAAPAVMTVTPARRRPSREQVVATSSSHRDEKRPLPAAQVYTMESISRLNLGLDVNPRDHSVVGQPSNYESEAGADPLQQHRENDGGVSLLGSSETVNPKVLRLPPDYRRFYP